MFEIINTLFCAIPILVIVVFVVLLFVYRKRKKEAPEAASCKNSAELNSLKTAIKVFGILSAVFAGVVVILGALFYMFVAYM